MLAFTANFQQCSTSLIPFISITSPSSHSRVCLKPTVISSALQSQVETLNGTTDGRFSERTEIRFGLPSKGRMASDTLDLLKVHSSESFYSVFATFPVNSSRFLTLYLFIYYSGVPGLSIVCQTSQSSAICCKYSTGTY